MVYDIAIVGSGIGGMATALALERFGHRVRLYEQASQLGRVGADVNLTPNAVCALDGLGIGENLRETAARPTHRISRMWHSGQETSRLELADAAIYRYGSPQLTIHRADLISALQSALSDNTLQLGHRLMDLEEQSDAVNLIFENGSEERADLVIGADGIHSNVRKRILGKESPEFTGIVAFRAVVPADRLEGHSDLGTFTKWWGPNPETQIVTFPLNRGRDVFIFATAPQETWHIESWTTPGDPNELRAMYSEFHRTARDLLEPVDHVLKSALYIREPLSRWSKSRVTLLGDACHPMMPFMAQGAGQAIEDAVILARAIEELGGGHQLDEILDSYEGARKERTSQIQIGSRTNEWLKNSDDAAWVYGYNAWEEPIGVPPSSD